MPKKTRYINLLRHQEKKLLDKLLDWAFTVGRAIVIITESVALSAFAYRFVLDRQIIDLRDKIKQEQTIVKLSESNESKFRSLQQRLEVAKKLDERGSEKTALLNTIVGLAQGKIAFRSVQISNESIDMEGITPSAGTISTFVSELRKHPSIQKVTLGTIAANTSTGTISVNIVASLRSTEPEAQAPVGGMPGIGQTEAAVDPNLKP